MLAGISMQTKLRLLTISALFMSVAMSGIIFYFLLYIPLNRIDRSRDVIVQIEKGSHLIAELQKERGRSAAYLSSASEEDLNRLRNQWKVTDRVIKSVPPDLRTIVSELPELRARVEKQRISVREAVGSYVRIINRILQSLVDKAKMIEEADLKGKALSALLIVGVTEPAGLERALLASVFGKDSMSFEERRKWEELLGAQEDFRKRQLNIFFSEDLRKLFNDTVKDDEVERYRRIARLRSEGFGISPDEWFTAATKRINNMWKLVDHILKDALETARATKRQLILEMALMGTFVVASLVVWFGLMVSVNNRLKTAVRELVDVVSYVTSEGRFDKPVRLGGDDEFGLIEKNFNELLRSLNAVIHEIKEVSSKIALGDFTRKIDLELKGDLGTIKESLNAVVDSLRTVVEEIKEVTGRASVGDFSRRIRVELKGDLNLIKEKLNRLMDVLEGLIGLISYIVANGKFDRRLEVQGSDELANVVDNFNRLVSSLDRVIQEIKEVTSKASTGDFSKRVEIELKGDLNLIKEKLNKLIDVLGSLNNAINEIANKGAVIEEKASSNERDLLNQKEAVERTATAVEEITTVIEDIANNVMEVSSASNETQETVSKSSSAVESLEASMQKIAGSRKEINEVVDTISNIAEQVSLLSLNAAIEAARAGEVGRGFAVVADEIGRLSQQVGNMAQHIRNRMEEVAENIEKGNRVVEEVISTFKLISDQAKRVNDMLQRIATSVEETAASAREVASNVQTIRDINEKNFDAIKEFIDSVSEMIELTGQAKKKLEELRD